MSATHYSVPEMIVKLREFCGCYDCRGGHRPGGEGNTPTSCVFAMLLKHYLENPDEMRKPEPEPDTKPDPEPRGIEPIELVFIVGGEDVPLTCVPDCTLLEARDRVLVESGNTGRPPEDWELRDINGALLAVAGTVGGFPSGTRFFLTLKVGAGGSG